jgi:large subunit ribosomal protein L17
MRHQKAGTKFNRTGSHRDAMFRNMVTSLFAYGKIRTTDAKAKELRRWADKIITLAKRGDLHARRQALSVVRSKEVVHKLFEEVSSRFGKRAGGYTRVIKIGRRTGDGAPISLVEFVGPEEKKEKKKKKKTKAAKKATPKPKKDTAAKKKAVKKKASEPAEAPSEEEPQKEAAPPEDETGVTENVENAEAEEAAEESIKENEAEASETTKEEEKKE